MGDAQLEFRTLVNCLIAMAAADGILHGNEIVVIREIYHKLVGAEIDETIVRKAYVDFQNSGYTSIYDVLTSAGAEIGNEMKKLIIKAGYLLMVSDGCIAGQETGQLAEIAALLEVPEDQFTLIIRELA